MRNSHRNKATIATLLTLLICMVLLPQQRLLAAENFRITDGSSVTLLYQITVPGDAGFSVRDIGRFVQGQHQLLPALEREVTGMKTGEKKRVELSVEEGFGPYDAKKKETVPRAELPSGVKKGDILEDRSGKPAMIAELSETSAVMDYNHPLAGKPLIVQITILGVDNPS